MAAGSPPGWRVLRVKDDVRRAIRALQYEISPRGLPICAVHCGDNRRAERRGTAYAASRRRAGPCAVARPQTRERVLAPSSLRSQATLKRDNARYSATGRVAARTRLWLVFASVLQPADFKTGGEKQVANG